MRFGSFIVPVSHDPDNDAQVIEETLREIETLEEAGVGVAFLSEHHIDGECAYADPLVFGGAVAARTSHIKIGFAVIKMTIHNPVHLAIQLSLLDNLSGGRVIVGTARGSRSKYYEYTAFGTTMEAGLERLDEAEELLVKTWTAKDLDFQGTHWQVRVPDIRPRPVQKPHPPLLRGCLTEASVVAMARIARPIMLGSASNAEIKDRLSAYHTTMLESGFDEETIQRTEDQNWVAKILWVADSRDEAAETIERGYRSWRECTSSKQVGQKGSL